MKLNSLILSLASLVLLSGQCPALAALVFSRAPINASGELYVSDLSPVAAADSQRADDFSLGGAAIVNRIRFWGETTGGVAGPNNFTIRFFGDGGGQPNTGFFDFRDTFTDITTASQFGVTVYTLDFADVALPAGTTWLSVLNSTPAAVDWQWYGNSVGPANHSSRDSNVDGWANAPELGLQPLNFELEVIPEPSTITLGLIAGAMGSFAGWRRSRKSRGKTADVVASSPVAAT